MALILMSVALVVCQAKVVEFPGVIVVEVAVRDVVGRAGGGGGVGILLPEDVPLALWFDSLSCRLPPPMHPYTAVQVAAKFDPVASSMFCRIQRPISLFN